MKIKDNLWAGEDDNMALCPPSKPAFVGVSEGTHIAICNMVADMGMQETKFGPKHQVYLRFEVPAERAEWTDDEGKQHTGPRNIGKTYNFILTEGSTLRAHMESWRGKTFADDELMDAAGTPIWDISKVVGKACQISVAKSDAGNSVIRSIIGLPKGFAAPAIEGDPIIYDGTDPGALNALPEWLRKAIQGEASDSASYANQSLPVPQEAPLPDDDIPF